MALQQAYIIDSSYIKTNYTQYCDSNVDDGLINSSILMAQDVNLQSNIGYTMWNFIITKLIQDPTGNSFSQQYLYLIQNYIQKAVSLWALYNAFPTIWTRITNKSIVTKKGDDSESVNLSTFNMLRNELKNNAMYYDSRTVEYISNFPGDFEEYYTTNGVNRIYPKSSAYSNGIYLRPVVGLKGNLSDVRLPGQGNSLNW